MKELMNYAGNILEELEEAETINCTKADGLFTFSAMCGSVSTLYCCS